MLHGCDRNWNRSQKSAIHSHRRRTRLQIRGLKSMRVVAFLHRWLGTASCLFFLVWFASGIVMMYAEMPELSEQERLTALPALDASLARLSAAAAIEHAELAGVSSIKLTSLFGRPVWRMLGKDGAWYTVFADTGEVRDAFQYQETLESLRPFLGAGARARSIEAMLEPDQWTVGGNYGSLRPLYHVIVDDAAKTELYVASATGEVVLRSTSRTRMLARIGAIPHWFYLTSIRKRGAVWRQLILWMSGTGCVVALLGLTVGVWRFSVARRYLVRGEKRRSPYVGTMRWHHWGGLIFGLLTLTWVFSGMLSMEPGNYSTGGVPTAAQKEAFSGAALDYHVFNASPAQLLVSHPGAKEIEIWQVAGSPYYLIWGTDGRRQLIDGAGEPVKPFSRDSLITAAEQAVPHGKIVEETLLSDYDAYYYDRDYRGPLPVLRLKFDDPQRSWLYVDSQRGALAARYERSGRVERWLYHGFHSFDFPFLWRLRPAWDITVIALCLGGFALSGTGVVLGYRRLRGAVLR